MNFERGQDPKHTLNIGQRTLIDKWFKEWAPEAEYTVDENLNIKLRASLYFYRQPISHLQDNLSVGGILDIRHTLITSLPENLSVEKWLNIRDTEIDSLPDSLKVKGYIYKDF